MTCRLFLTGTSSFVVDLSLHAKCTQLNHARSVQKFLKEHVFVLFSSAIQELGNVASIYLRDIRSSQDYIRSVDRQGILTHYEQFRMVVIGPPTNARSFSNQSQLGAGTWRPLSVDPMKLGVTGARAK